MKSPVLLSPHSTIIAREKDYSPFARVHFERLFIPPHGHAQSNATMTI